MATYSDSVNPNDTTFPNPSDASSENQAALGDLRRFTQRPSVRAAGISTLALALLGVMSRPVFWLDSKYLDSPPDNEQVVPESVGPNAVADDSTGTQTIVLPTNPFSDNNQADENLDGSTGSTTAESVVSDSAATGPLGRFRSPTAPGEVNPAPSSEASSEASSEETTAEPPQEEDLETPAPATEKPPLQLDLSAVLQGPPTAVFQSDGSTPLTAFVPVLPDLPVDNPQIVEEPVSPESIRIAVIERIEESSYVEPEPIEPDIAALGPASIAVDQFTITGNQEFDDETLARIAWEAATNGDLDGPPPGPIELARSQLIQASDAITQYYLEENYISSGAYIPEESWASGIPEIRVLEGTIEAIEVDVQGPGLKLEPSYVADRLALVTRGALNLDELVEGVRLLEQDPLIEQITTEIEPGTENGTSILAVEVIQDDGFDVNLSATNDNSPSVGSSGQEISISQANLVGIGDRLRLGYERTSGSDRWNFGYSLPLNARNGTLSFNVNTVESEVIEEPFDILGIESSSQTYELSFRQPLILTPTEEFALSLTGYHRNSEGAFLEALLGEAQPFPTRGSDLQGRTRISALRFGQNWIKRQPKQVISLLSEFSLGIGALNATINPIRPDSRFFLWR
ncbi:MAG: ShlB/FhaC/HecB family hemolysin secretion/activation protein, partial [Cyanobacteria bacterium J06642_11]